MGGKSSSELSRLVLCYKKICHQEKIWMIGAVSLAMTAFYIIELGFNTSAGYVLGTRVILPLGLSLLTLVLGLVFAKWQRRRHARHIITVMESAPCHEEGALCLWEVSEADASHLCGDFRKK